MQIDNDNLLLARDVFYMLTCLRLLHRGGA